jgi:SAM-dependent methyltransferase
LKKIQPWFKEWFNTQEYLDLYKHRDDTDAAKIIKLLFENIKLPKNAKVLDLACGNGRHSVLFAKKGFSVTGIDLSGYLISKAEEKRKKEYSKYSKRLKFEIGDMRHIRHKNEFNLVVNLFSSFGYFDNEKDNFDVLKSIARALVHGGYFFLDFLNSGYLLNNLVPYDVKKERGKTIVQIRSFINGFVEKNIIIIKNNPSAGKSPVVNRYKEKIRLYSISDFRKMFAQNGLNILKVFGSYSGNSYNNEKSERLIILAQKT